MLSSGALSSLGLGGVLITLGYSAGRQTTIDVTDLIWKRARMAGVPLFAQSPMGTAAGTSIDGNKLRTGVAQFLTLRAARKVIRPVLVYGAPAMPADTLSCLAQQIGACAASLPRFQRSVVTSRACDGFHLTPRPRWSMLSTRTRERGRAESHHAGRQLLVATSLLLPPTAARTRSISIFSPFRNACRKTR